MKKNIPNILTCSRLVATPFILYVGIKGNFLVLIFLCFFLAITDFFDGKLARKWNVSSEIGAKLDTIGDKCLAFSFLIILVSHHHSFFYIFILESLIAIFNLYTYYKTKIVESLIIGKIKTWVIFTTIFLGFVNLFFDKINIPLMPFVLLTLLMQLAALIQYVNAYNVNKQQKKKLNFENKEYYKIVEPILNHKEFLKRKEFAHHFNESVYDHVLRVSYDCYRIGKKLHLDYKALAIAGLLHDFYTRPWQDNFERVPFFQKHGFVHAEDARKNALKYFPEFMNKKIESMIKTHMFPLNKKLPEYKESWLLTFVDKVDSMDFLFHPLLLSKKARKLAQEKKGVKK